MNPQVTVLEQVVKVGPFGVRFWDVAAIAPAAGGLSVVAYPQSYPELRVDADVNHTNVYVFNDLPGMRSVENGRGDDDFWLENPPMIPFIVEVTDPQQRYLPYQFSALMPSHGLFMLGASPLSNTLTPDPTWLPLFSDPARTMPGPCAVIRALLKDDSVASPLATADNSAAAWALVTAQVSGAPVMTGLADDRGAVSMAVSYPEPRNSPFASPLGPGSLKLSDQTWPLTISVFYSANTGSGPLPDLESVLQQPVAKTWQDTAHSAPANNFTLQFGNELVLRSLDSATGLQLPVLLVTKS
jgi:hypothetical protein